MNSGVELLMNVTPRETRVALVDNGILTELHIERESNLSLVGNIYKGKVVRVLPGMQSAFIDIGLDKNAFLHASDIISHTECIDPGEQQNFVVKDISELVRDGQDIVVQVVKDPIGTKGAKLTTDITIPSRYLVFMPGNSYVGVSQRIETEEERARLKNIVEPLCDELGGFIIRTAAEGIDEKEFIEDANFLKRIWRKVIEKKDIVPTKSLLYGEISIALRLLRDFIGSDIDHVMIDSNLTFQIVGKFCDDFMPELNNKITLYKGPQPLFTLYDIENKIKEALNNRVDLKSGGYLIIEHTEAMTTIDVNTGTFVGRRNLEDTVFNTNLEATSVIAQQLQLRNIGGLVVIDFIDMNNEQHQQIILKHLREFFNKDRARTVIYDFSPLGLVEMARKRTKKSLEELLCETCPECQGRGNIRSLESLFFEVIREIVRINNLYSNDNSKIIVYASNKLAEYLADEESYGMIAEVEMFTNKQIEIRKEPYYRQEEFDVVFS